MWQISTINTPCGEMVLGAADGRLCMVAWPDGRACKGIMRRLQAAYGAPVEAGKCEVIDEAARQLSEYFDGLRRTFDLDMTLVGTPLQRSVWEALAQIPYGTTITYGQLAARLGRPGSARAVASAVGANPISIILPCHRVTGVGGALTGYAGGLHIKARLLAIEA